MKGGDKFQHITTDNGTNRKGWTRYTAGIDGLVNKMIVQLLVSGAISVEGVPNDKLDGLATAFIKS